MSNCPDNRVEIGIKNTRGAINRSIYFKMPRFVCLFCLIFGSITFVNLSGIHWSIVKSFSWLVIVLCLSLGKVVIVVSRRCPPG